MFLKINKLNLSYFQSIFKPYLIDIKLIVYSYLYIDHEKRCEELVGKYEW